jgi:hypothetical protein
MEEAVNTLKLLGTAAVLALVATPAAAVTVKNDAAAEITIGVDMGDKEEIKTVGAGKSVKLDCPDGCGVTGPWGFSWMASGDDTITTNGQALVTVMDEKKAE